MDYKKHRPKVVASTTIPTTQPTLISQEEHLGYTSDAEPITQESSFNNTPSTLTFPTQYRTIIIIKRLLLKYIHQ